MGKKTGQEELDEYIFTRPEMAKLLGITTNALRMRMRKGRCDLDYRFDGTQFKFKRLPRDRLITMNRDQPKTSHEKALYDYDKKVQKRYNRGATHKGKAKYPNEVFKLQNEMKVMNHIQGKFKSVAHRKEFEKLNEEGLKIAQENLRKKEKKSLGVFGNRPKYGGMIYGDRTTPWQLPYDMDAPRPPRTSFHLGGRPYSDLVGKNHKEKEDVEIHQRDLPPDDREPEFKNKVEESIWRLKNKK
ncbi:MAG TPA: hypothetical protein DCS66_00010 [Flavobacteriaceae bacterium]|nr:hypothetical protein [Flavobacteriaceae bacterium]